MPMNLVKSGKEIDCQNSSPNVVPLERPTRVRFS
jgi:hypothetical protein